MHPLGCLPPTLPCALARTNPARVLSLRRSRSNSAKTPSIPFIIRPAALEKSSPSRKVMNTQPRVSTSWKNATSSDRSRPHLSRLQITQPSACRVRSNLITSSRWGRVLREDSISTNSPTTTTPVLVAHFLNSISWFSAVCSFVETRAYKQIRFPFISSMFVTSTMYARTVAAVSRAIRPHKALHDP